MTIKLHDSKIGADNYTTAITIGQYLEIARKIIGTNEYQRKRVKHSATVYSLLKKDIIEGCVIPPIVLAYTGADEVTEKDIAGFLEAHSQNLLILDGLQRTYTLLDAKEEISVTELLFEENAKTREFLSRRTRIEFYAGINRIGILYRMLTLNTGQTPMTLRQQVEMLYFDYAQKAPPGITFIKEVDDGPKPEIGRYHFKDIVEGFNSYLERNELPIDRFDLLESIQNLKNLASENQKSDIFTEFVLTYHAYVEKITELTTGIELNEEDLGINGIPFGSNAFSIFSKAQSISGFGAALGRLKDSGSFRDFQEIRAAILLLRVDENPEGFIVELLKRLDDIRLTSKKIGNAQRMYFQYFFRALLNKDADTYLHLAKSVTDAHQKYRSQVF